MTVHLVTFSDESMSRAADLCVRSARHHGVDYVLPWTRAQFLGSGMYRTSDVAESIVALMMVYDKGLGFWSWKPFVITESMELLINGDYLIYSDAGIEFINNVNYIIDRMGHKKPRDDIWLFGNSWEHAHWCKRDVIEAIWPTPQCPGANCEMDHNEIAWKVRYGKQVQASVIFFRVSGYTRSFVAEWLKWCLFEGGRLIDDSPSRLPNHPEFREHRHDQAILTTMAYREGIKLHYWPAVYNRFLGQEFVYSREGYSESDNYPSLFHHHRLRNSEFQALGITV